MGYGRLEYPVSGVIEGVKMALAKTDLYEFREDNTDIWVKLKDSVRQQQRVFVHSGGHNSSQYARY